MKFQNVAGLAVLIVTVAFAIQLVQQNGVEAQETSSQQMQQSSISSVEYARLRVESDGENVTWLISGTDRVRTESIRAAYRRLGGQDGRGRFSDLLDQIGSEGWNLIQTSDNTWIFSRRAS